MKKNFIFIIVLVIFVSILLISLIHLNNEKISKGNKIDEHNKVDKKEINTETIDNKEESENVKQEENIPKTEQKENEIQNEIKNKNVSSIELIGDEEITLNLGDKYVEYGAKAYNTNGEDISDSIIIDSSVDITKVGTYKVSYSIGNYIVIRTIIIK